MTQSSRNVPVSTILKNASQFEDEPKKKSREDWRKAKELEEARKAGNAPAAVDEDGKDINPHIPQYISDTPWYFQAGASHPTLKHQKPQPEKQNQVSSIKEWYIRGATNKVASKWRPGACDNCGAMGHKRKDCFERPRARMARYSNANIAADDQVQPDLKLDFDAKRDRWAGYNADEYKSVITEYQQVEEVRKRIRADKVINKNDGQENDDEEQNSDDEQNSDEDEDKYADHADMPGTKVDSKERITVRNLRIREDTAKYLRNLDPNSAYYDPKTRSMRDNPYAGTANEDVDYKGENAARFTGDTRDHANAQVFAWSAAEKGVNAHLLAEPTKAEILKKEFDKKRTELKDTARNTIIDKYGGEEHLELPPRELLLDQSEAYIEYSRTGRIIKGAEKKVVQSRYEEDVYNNNHTSVFGSYWYEGRWGYKCCHAYLKNSYCCGEAGKKAVEHAEAFAKGKVIENEEDASSSEEEVEEITTFSVTEKTKKDKKKRKKEKKKKEKKDKAEKKDEKENKLKEALRKEEESKREAEELLKLDERKRPYNSMFSVKEPTEEEKEAYQMKRPREEDPMAHFSNN